MLHANRACGFDLAKAKRRLAGKKQSIPFLICGKKLRRDGARICLGKDVEGEALKASLPRHRFDIVSITLSNRIELKHSTESGVARSGDGLVNVAWVVLHCNRRIGARERRQLIPHVRCQVPFLGRKVN